MTKLQFIKGPRVCVHIESVDGELCRAELALSDVFSCQGASPALIDWLRAYAEGIAAPLPLFRGTPFQKKVMEAMQQIPFGRTISYSALASLCGNPKAARAAGSACRNNPLPLFIPCHRVIRANGEIGGFAYDIEIKKRLLAFEARELPPHVDY